MEVSLADLRAAAHRVAGVAVRSALVDVPALGAVAGVPVGLKCENEQPTGAFKLRGAYNAIARMVERGETAGVVTHSSGNHAQAVAFAAQRLGLRAVVVMPESAPAIKAEGVRRYGGEVVFAGRVRSSEQHERAEAIAAAEGLVMVSSFDHPDVVAGQGTVGLEILEQRPDVGTILVPVSGGGLLAGICVAIQSLAPNVEVVGVEPAGAPKLSAALAAGEPRTLAHTESMADGLLMRSVGRFTFPILHRTVRRAIQVGEDEIAAAVRWLHREAGITAEPSGAVTTAALLAGKASPAGPTVAVVSGGNVDPALFHRLTA